MTEVPQDVVSDEDRGFIAEEVIKPVRYNFATQANPDGPSGVMAEPSYEKVKKFRKVVADMLAKRMESLPDEKKAAELSARDQIELVGRFLAEDDTQEHTAIITALSELCFIPRPVLTALPYRIQQAWLAHMAGLFLTPQTMTGGI